MKAYVISTGIVSVLLLGGLHAQGQMYPNNFYPGYGPRFGWFDNGYHASTAAEGYARGMADVIRSQGQYNLMNSQAAVNMTQAQRQAIENQKLWTDTYFRMRETNAEYRAKNRRPTPTREDWIRYAQAGKPARLSPGELDTVNGTIHWPSLLDTSTFASYRTELEKLFAERAQAGSMDGDSVIRTRQITQAMLQDLKGQISDVPSSEYLRARRFIESLAYESTMPKS